jgi:hypothetical protein
MRQSRLAAFRRLLAERPADVLVCTTFSKLLERVPELAAERRCDL